MRQRNRMESGQREKFSGSTKTADGRDNTEIEPSRCQMSGKGEVKRTDEWIERADEERRAMTDEAKAEGANAIVSRRTR